MLRYMDKVVSGPGLNEVDFQQSLQGSSKTTEINLKNATGDRDSRSPVCVGTDLRRRVSDHVDPSLERTAGRFFDPDGCNEDDLIKTDT